MTLAGWSFRAWAIVLLNIFHSTILHHETPFVAQAFVEDLHQTPTSHKYLLSPLREEVRKGCVQRTLTICSVGQVYLIPTQFETQVPPYVCPYGLRIPSNPSIRKLYTSND